jgi:NitT/TauT family transport system substrate-binding protein
MVMSWRNLVIEQTRSWVVIALLVSLATSSAVAQTGLTVLRVNGAGTDDITPLIYALRTGMFRKEGLDVELSLANNGAATMAAVVSGSYDIGKSSLIPLANAHLRNLPLVIIAAGGVNDARDRPFAELAVAVDAPLKTARDLNGKTVAVSGLSDLSAVAVDAWMDKNGGESTTLHFLELSVSAMPEAVAEHRVDAAMILQPIMAAGIANGQIRSLAIPYHAIAPVFVGSGWFATKDFVTQHADAVRKFARVMYQAATYTNRHNAETAPMMADLTKVSMSVYSTMPRIPTATSTRPEWFQPLIDAAAKYHVIPESFPARDFLWSGL